MKNISIIGALIIMTSCASRVDWKREHYENANKGARCMQLMNTGQAREANELGCSNLAQNTPNSTSTAQSNGNISNIYINGSNGAQNAPNHNASQQFYDVFKTLYEQERRNREHLDNNYNSGL